MNGFDLSTISGIFVGGTEYSAIYKGSTLIWENNPGYTKDYLTIESLENNNVIGWKKSGSNAPTGTIQYSTDNTTWTSVTPDTTGVTLATLNTGDKLYLRGNNDSYCVYAPVNYYYNMFTSTKKYNVYGNIMSLINASTFSTLKTFSTDKVFFGLFKNSKVVDASNLVLPATTLVNYCYDQMFYGCTSLTTAPELPATTLANYCYEQMFYGCTSLTTAPELPDLYNLSKTFTKQGQYQGMFENCKALTYVPDFSVYKLSHYCCQNMFQNCISLVDPPNIKCYSLNGNGAMQAMFKGCINLRKFKFDFVSTSSDYSNVSNCFKEMFYGCSSLNYIKYSFVVEPTSATNSNWVYGISEFGTFVNTNANTNVTTWTVSNDCIPNGWIVQNVNVPDYDYSTQYFTIEFLEDDTYLKWCSYNSSLPSLSYSVDGGQTWNTTQSGSYNSSYDFLVYYGNKGTKVLIKCNHQLSFSTEGSSYRFFSTSNKKVNVYGNIMSLMYDDNFTNQTTIYAYQFYYLFKSMKIVDAYNLILPSTILPKRCYAAMFWGQTYLKQAPILIPAILPNDGCYYGMFNSCTNLTYIKMMTSNWRNTIDTSNWVYNVQINDGTFVMDEKCGYRPISSSGIPSGWTIVKVSS